MYISGKEIITIEDKNFIQLSDAMQVIAPTSSNSARWFKKHQDLFPTETFIYSDERFPGKENRIWLTVPEGFQYFAQACIKAPRLKIVEGVEERIKPFLCLSEADGQAQSEFGIRNSEFGIKEGSTDKSQFMEGPPWADDLDIIFEQEISVETILKEPGHQDAEPQAGKEEGSQAKITEYPMTEEKIYGMDFDMQATPKVADDNEAKTEFLTRSLSIFARGYYSKMGWLDKINKEAPVELHNPIVDLFNTLHDTLLNRVVEEILRFEDEPTVVEKEKSYAFEKCLAKGYTISFEAVKEGICCSILSAKAGTNAIGQNWKEAFEKAAEPVLLLNS